MPTEPKPYHIPGHPITREVIAEIYGEKLAEDGTFDLLAKYGVERGRERAQFLGHMMHRAHYQPLSWLLCSMANGTDRAAEVIARMARAGDLDAWIDAPIYF